MAQIKKLFTQEYVSNDCEGRYWNWEDSTETYDDLKNQLMTEWNGWFDGVAIVEKIFDDETFTITERVIKRAKRKYDGFHWVEGEIVEEIFEDGVDK